MSGLLGTNQLLQMPTMLEDLPLMSQQASVPHEKLGSLTHQLYDQVPFLKCIDFEVDHVSKTQTIGGMTLLPSEMNSSCTVDLRSRLQISVVAKYLTALTLAMSFPKAYMFCHGSVCGAPSLVFVKPFVQTALGLLQDNRLQGRCSVDQDALLDQELIFHDRGQCDIPMYIQFFHHGSLMTIASSTFELTKRADHIVEGRSCRT